MFDVAADAYDRFMGRFSIPLAVRLADALAVPPGGRVLDVGCGPGALTAELVSRLGPEAVAAVDPSEPFVAAVRERFPAVDVQHAGAEALPHPDGAFDVAAAQLVVHFMADPVAGLREMARVTRPGGTVAACVWDLAAGGGSPLAPAWQAARDVDPAAPDESRRPGGLQGSLVALAAAAGLGSPRETVLRVEVPMTGFDDWWEPVLLGVGPIGTYLAGLDPGHRAAVRERCAGLLPDGPFEATAAAWCMVATVPA